ncbi:MAG: Uma2 family endonuclease [Hyphomicrobium aestuarii]|nr:Uma2 family endonuclease [Hyphomicrobium aestuarii]
MGAALRLDTRLTEAEYFDFELRGDARYEFADGLVFAMVGGTDRHNLICGDFFLVLGTHLPLRCQVFEQSMKLRVTLDRTIRYFYPDILVSCRTTDRAPLFRAEPVLLGEVLSKSTEQSDRADKLPFYRSIPALEEHVIVFQDIPQVELFRRRTSWQPEVFTMGQTMTLESVDLTIPVASLYRRVTF